VSVLVPIRGIIGSNWWRQRALKLFLPRRFHVIPYRSPNPGRRPKTTPVKPEN
jgi:hypothetical protein